MMGDYGSWTKCATKKLACNLVKKAVNILETIDVCPSHKELNKLFNPLKIYIDHE